jgi:Endonuclease/Exonuclease/phosphatase family
MGRLYHQRSKKGSTSSASKRHNNTAASKKSATAATSLSWVDRLRFIPVAVNVENEGPIPSGGCNDDDDNNNDNDNEVNVGDTPNDTNHFDSSCVAAVDTITTTISILTWNVLAQSYCSRQSQVQLPKEYQRVVFHRPTRQERLLHVLQQLTCIPTCTSTASNTTTTTTTTIHQKYRMMDVICLQEVDLVEIRPLLTSLGYHSVVETPRCVAGTAVGGRIDGCAIYIRSTTTTSRSTSDSDDHNTTTMSSSSSIHDSNSNNNNICTPSTENHEDSSTVTVPTLPTQEQQQQQQQQQPQEGEGEEQNALVPPIQPPSSSSSSSSSPPLIQWKLLDWELIRLDDIATLSSSSSTIYATAQEIDNNNNNNNNNIGMDAIENTKANDETTNHNNTTTTPNDHNTHTNTTNSTSNYSSGSSSSCSNIQGIQQSLLRRNMAIIVRLQHCQSPQRTILIVNAHLFWNPAFEYVKVRVFSSVWLCVHVNIFVRYGCTDRSFLSFVYGRMRFVGSEM